MIQILRFLFSWCRKPVVGKLWRSGEGENGGRLLLRIPQEKQRGLRLPRRGKGGSSSSEPMPAVVGRVEKGANRVAHVPFRAPRQLQVNVIQPEIVVPCDSCTACCRGRAIRPLYSERGDAVETYVHQYVEGIPVLAWNSNGDCIYVSPEGCTIHTRRPALCRGYDCRVAYLNLTRRQRWVDVRKRPYQKAIYAAARKLLKEATGEAVKT